MSNGIDVVRLLEDGKTVQIKPQGYSMYPMFLPGRDSAVLSKVNQNRLRRGDVVLYRRDTQTLVMHRIWKVTKNNVFLVGDNQSSVEGPIKKSKIIGILVFFLRKNKKISVHNLIYRLISRGWLILRPFRDIIKRFVGGIGRWR
jgi:signal peptidase I